MVVGSNMYLNVYQVIMGYKNDIVCQRDIIDI